MTHHYTAALGEREAPGVSNAVADHAQSDAALAEELFRPMECSDNEGLLAGMELPDTNDGGRDPSAQSNRTLDNVV